MFDSDIAVIERFVRSHSTHRIPNELWDESDRQTLQDTLILWCLIIGENTWRYTGVRFVRSHVWKAVRHIISLPSDILFRDLDVLRDWFNAYLNGLYTGPVEAAQQLRVEIRSAGGDENFIVLVAAFESLLVTDPVTGVSVLRTILEFPTRLSLDATDYLSDTALKDYIEFEHNLLDIEPHPWFTDWCSNLIDPLVWQEAIDKFAPRHSNGSTADCGRDVDTKNTSLEWYPRWNYLLRSSASYTYFKTFFSARTVSSKPKSTAKVAFVPKSSTKLRTICMESASFMFFQQGIMEAIRFSLKQGRLRRRVLHEDDNRRLAREASIDGNLVTIDLSNASDSVTASFVRQCFSHSVIAPWLDLARSDHCLLPNGNILKQKKFAPMGSALCFDVESIVFAMICEFAIVSEGGSVDDSSYRVYGDDIIIEQEYADQLIELLVTYGFEPNVSKSFTGWQPDHCFRESCGVEAYNGVDVTPLRISRWFRGVMFQYSDADIIGKFDTLCNELLIRGYLAARSFILSYRQKSRYAPLFSEIGCDLGIWSFAPNNQFLSRPSNRSVNLYYHRPHYYYLLSVRSMTHYDDEEMALFHWLRYASQREDREPILSPIIIRKPGRKRDRMVTYPIDLLRAPRGGGPQWGEN